METPTADLFLFGNADWIVTSAGLEHRGTGYFITSAQLADRRSDGLWAWPLQMAEKSWCDPEAFSEAFSHAVAARGIAPDAGLVSAFVAANRDAEQGEAWHRAARRLRLGEGRPLSLAEVVDTAEVAGSIGLTGPQEPPEVVIEAPPLPQDRRAVDGQRRAKARTEKPRAVRPAARLLAWLRVGLGVSRRFPAPGAATR